MNDYYLQGELYRQLLMEHSEMYSSDMLSVYSSEEWANIADMVITLHRNEPDIMSPKKSLELMKFGMEK